jgi:hypothetical protein
MPLIRFKQINKDITGDVTINGSLTVQGKSVFVQTSSAYPAITISGSAHIVPSNYSGSLYIQGLGTFSDTGSNQIVDLGNESF